MDIPFPTRVSGSLPVTVAVEEWLRAVLGPDVAIVEGSRVPHDLVHELGDLDRVRRRASAVELIFAGEDSELFWFESLV